ncbi:MAG: hypothetical protein IKV00_07250 [Clostridia bacterium]|nr:hypothetical protein [Clostridia bacterium]
MRFNKQGEFYANEEDTVIWKLWKDLWEPVDADVVAADRYSEGAYELVRYEIGGYAKYVGEEGVLCVRGDSLPDHVPLWIRVVRKGEA